MGTLSDTYNDWDTASYGTPLTTASTDEANGDLPAGMVVLDDTGGPGSDAGRAMMQLIHDVAPGAAQMFHAAFNGRADFAQGILDLDAAGCDIIVDDVGYFAEPMFRDGIIAQAVDTVVNNGKSYFSSAGNAARNSYQAAYTDGIPPTYVYNRRAHDFAAGGDDFFQGITIPDGARVTISLQWDQPYASATGGAGATSDLDLYLLDDPPTKVIAVSNSENIGGDPTEVFQFRNNVAETGTTAFALYGEYFAGQPPGQIKYIVSLSGNVTINEYTTNSSTVYGHPNAAGARAVGAAAFFETPAFGQTPPLLKPFSSAVAPPFFSTFQTIPYPRFAANRR